MATCGYLCPQCEGRGFVDSGETCDWCKVTVINPPFQKPLDSINESDREEWMRKVHEGPCCGDLGLEN